MARLFDDASEEYLKIDQAVVSGVPLAMAAFFKSDDLANNQVIISLTNAAGSSIFMLWAAGPDGGDPIRVQTGDEVSGAVAGTSSGYSAGTLHHACGIFASATDRRVFIDGGSKGTNAVNITPVNLNTTSIGARIRAAVSLPMSGLIAEAAIWDLSNWPGATNSDKADNFEKILDSLAGGYSPRFFSLGLKAHWQLIRDEDIDIVGGYNMTPFNTPSIIAHPPIIYPQRALLGKLSAIDITATPATLATAATLHAPTVITTRNVTIVPSTLAIEATLHAPTIVIGGEETVVCPQPLEVVATLHAPHLVIPYAEIPPFMHKDLIDFVAGGAWLWLVEIVVPGYNVVRIARNTENVHYGEDDFQKFNLQIGEQIFSGDGSIPRVTLRTFQDYNRAIEDLINEAEGALGAAVKLIRVNEKFLDIPVAALEQNYSLLASESDHEWVTFTLGIPNPLTQRFPLGEFSSSMCPWASPESFGGPRCQYTGSDATCTGTYDDCRTKGNAEHWGAFLGLDPNVIRV